MKDCINIILKAQKIEKQLRAQINYTKALLDFSKDTTRKHVLVEDKCIVEFTGSSVTNLFSGFKLTSCIVDEKLSFGQYSAFYKILKFEKNFLLKNTVYSKEVDFNGTTFDCDVQIEHTVFKETVLFRKVSFTKVTSFDKSVFLQDILFENCTFSDVLAFRDIKVKGSLIFRNCIFKKELNFYNKSVVCENIKFIFCNKGTNVSDPSISLDVCAKNMVEWEGMRGCNLSFYDNFLKQHINISPKVSYKDCDISSFEPLSTFENVQTQIIVMDSTIQGEIDLSDRKIIKPIEFKNCEFKKEANFRNTQFLQKVKFYRSNFIASVDFRISDNLKNAPKFHNNIEGSFHDSIFEEKVIFYHRQFSKISFENTKFKKLVDFYNTTFYKDVCFFKTDFEGTSVFAKATFHGVAVFLYSQVAKNMILRGANFEKGVNFALVNFIGEGYINPFDTIINSFISFPEKNCGLIDEGENWKTISHNYKRETYRILKNEALKQNNRIKALDFHGDEMEAHTLFVKEVSSTFLYFSGKNYLPNKLYEFFISRFQNLDRSILPTLPIAIFILPFIIIPAFNSDLFVLRINQITNKHGSDWKRGFLFTIVTSAFFFTLYWISLKAKPVEFNIDASWEHTKGALGIVLSYFAHFTNPTHWTSFMPDAFRGNWSIFIDISSRLFIGLGFYQTIQAFRKYGRF